MEHVFRLDTYFFGESGVDCVLNDQLRHYFPGFSCSSVGVVRAVDLQHVGPGHYFLGFACVYERTNAVYVSVEDVVLRVLVSAVYAFFREENGYVRSCHA